MASDKSLIDLVEPERLVQLAAGGAPVSVNGNAAPLGYSPGDVVAGKYRLVRLLGQGGMGVVWEAHSDALDIRVAIKLIHQNAADNEEQKRLLIEAKAAARLVDPGVVRVFDCGETLNGEPYVVMEFLEGADLASYLDERGRFLPIEAVRTLLPIVRALGTAHAANIVHRDVKPENVFLTQSATGEVQPKLVDFGIARMLDAPWAKRLTQAGSALGSPNYMSPEQARGEEVDRRTDLWAICVVLYEAVTGQLPFDGDSYNALMYAVLSAPIPTFAELGIEEPELWELVARGLERSRSARWQTSEELSAALCKWLIARGVLHDVSGVSLHATQNNRRVTHVRTLESGRPLPMVSCDSVPPNRKGLPTTSPSVRPISHGRLWHGRPRWFTPTIVVLGLCGVGIALYRWQERQDFQSGLERGAQPVLPTGPDPRPVAVVPTAAAIAATVAVSPPPPVVSPPGSAAVTARPALQTAAPKPSVKKPPKPDPFKSPFD
jgi:serine/threonine-protein kinase